MRGRITQRSEPQAHATSEVKQDGEKVVYFVIQRSPRRPRNLSLIETQEKKERFFASLRMTKGVGAFFGCL
jgi:hypothetical protein